MTPTLIEARDDLYATLNVDLDGVDAVYQHEPTAEVSGPCYVTLQLERITPTDQVWAVRVYVQMLNDPDDALGIMDVALAAVDDRLGERPYGPSVWDVTVNDELGALVARSFVDVERLDF